MTVSTTIATKTYVGDGSTSTFPTVFAFFAETDIEVIERTTATGLESVKTLTTDYTVTGGSGVPGSVDALVAPPATVSWTIRRVLSETQETDLPVAGSMPANAVEQMVDRAIMQIQQHSEEFGRTLTFPKTDPSTLTTELPSSVSRADKFMGFDSSGNVVATAGSLGFSAGTAALPAVSSLSDLDTGVYWPAADTLGFSTGGVERARIDSAGYQAQAGSVSAPSISFEGDRDTGIYSPGADEFAISTGGAQRLLLNSTGLQSAVNGSASNPSYSWSSDTDSGIFRVGSNVIGFSVAAIEVLRLAGTGGSDENNVEIAASPTGAAPTISAFGSDTNIGVRLNPKGTGQVEGPDGTAALPGYSFNSDLDTGMSRLAADTLGFSTGGSERARIDSSGKLGIGTTAPDFIFHALKGGTPGIAEIVANHTVARFQNSGTGSFAIVDIIANTAGQSIIGFGDNDAAGVGRITYNHAENSMFFNTNGNERLRITSAGVLDFATGTSGGILTDAQQLLLQPSHFRLELVPCQRVTHL